MLLSPEIKIIRSEVLRSPPRRQFNFCLKQFWSNGRDNGDRYFVLESKNIRQVTLEPVRPNVRPVAASINCPVMRTFPDALRTDPSRT